MKIIYGRIKEKNIKNLLYSHQNLIILKNLHTYKLKKKAHIIQI